MFVAVFLGYNQYWPGGFMVLWFYVQEHPKAQQSVVLVLKRLRRRGHRLKSLVTPGLPRRLPCKLHITFITYKIF